MIGMGGLARVGAMVRRGQAFLGRALLGRFPCPRCGAEGPHALLRVGEAFECISCDEEVDGDDLMAALRESSS